MSSEAELAVKRAARAGQPLTTHDAWVIEPRPAILGARIRELWQYRYLLGYFGGRALQKLYMRTVLGWAWVFIRPLFPLATGALIFGNFMGVESETIPYFLFFMVGMTAWNLFSSALLWATRSIELNRKILRKMYFPRLLLPVASLTPALVETGIYLVLITITTVYFALLQKQLFIVLGPGLLVAVGALMLIVLLALGIGLWTSVYAASARDVRFTVGYVLGFWFFLTPVIYPLGFVPPNWKWLIDLNPMASFVEAFKWGMLGIGGVRLTTLAAAVAVTLLILMFGLRFFVRAEAESIDRM